MYLIIIGLYFIPEDPTEYQPDKPCNPSMFSRFKDLVKKHFPKKNYFKVPDLGIKKGLSTRGGKITYCCDENLGIGKCTTSFTGLCQNMTSDAVPGKPGILRYEKLSCPSTNPQPEFENRKIKNMEGCDILDHEADKKNKRSFSCCCISCSNSCFINRSNYFYS
jgi:hypothetical protein